MQPQNITLNNPHLKIRRPCGHWRPLSRSRQASGPQREHRKVRKVKPCPPVTALANNAHAGIHVANVADKNADDDPAAGPD